MIDRVNTAFVTVFTAMLRIVIFLEGQYSEDNYYHSRMMINVYKECFHQCMSLSKEWHLQKSD